MVPDGLGTAAKPAFEPIVVARKPLAGTVAANVLAHGTGALNIDGCRIDYTSSEDKESAKPGGKATSRNGSLAGKAQECDEQSGPTANPTDAQTTGTSATSLTGSAPSAHTRSTPRTEFQPSQGAGRWPANVILDESQAAALDEQSGYQKDGVAVTRNRQASYEASAYQVVDASGEDKGYGGGASRFFYCAKAPKKERPEVDGVKHPTVKPLKLMRYLVRLVTPPGGVVVDPFAGSGATVEAALLEGFDVVGIEREAEYLPLVEQRIERAEGGAA